MGVLDPLSPPRWASSMAVGEPGKTPEVVVESRREAVRECLRGEERTNLR